MKTLYRDCRNHTELPSGAALISDMPAWISLMGMEWLYNALQKLSLFSRSKANR
ncbi:hypothetical protein [Egbenema bharatensis]|uniref:hypothetical protein n=1 Tax=Egbenema bharatensis TaxID=3463334 RepID=UPI003A845871